MLIPHGFFPGIEGIYLSLKTRTDSFHPSLHLLTFSLYFFFKPLLFIYSLNTFIHSINMLDIMPGTMEMKEPWTLADINQTQPRTYFRTLFLRKKHGG